MFDVCYTRLTARPAPLSGLGLGACQRRRFFGRAASSKEQVVLEETVYDKTAVHYGGKIFGISTDALVFYAKASAAFLVVFMTLRLFFRSYEYLLSFSIATVGRLGFVAGFGSCAVLYTLALQLKRRYLIPPNAVYNQAIAMVLKDPRVTAHLGSYPKTGNFRAYCSTGGFKLPLLRRLRSGSYELSDLLGTKPRQLQMMFVLRGPNGREGLVSCDVRKMETGLLSSTHHFQSLAILLSDPATKDPVPLILIGREEDVVFRGMLKL